LLFIHPRRLLILLTNFTSDSYCSLARKRKSERIKNARKIKDALKIHKFEGKVDARVRVRVRVNI